MENYSPMAKLTMCINSGGLVLLLAVVICYVIHEDPRVSDARCPRGVFRAEQAAAGVVPWHAVCVVVAPAGSGAPRAGRDLRM